ncbi:MAG: SET domain-containing protein [Anaerolineae bacterium]
MIHPHTRLVWINSEIGYGVFTTAFIPRGTIVYVEDALDIRIGPDSPLLSDPRYMELIARYSTRDARGNRWLSWDIGKYVNHCCHYNCLDTAYGFEIAVRDIQAGEEITDDYGLFNLEQDLVLCGHCEDCRRVVRPDDFDRRVARWDQEIKEALKAFHQVPQPLLTYVDAQAYEDLAVYLATGQEYKSVRVLRYHDCGSRDR